MTDRPWHDERDGPETVPAGPNTLDEHDTLPMDDASLPGRDTRGAASTLSPPSTHAPFTTQFSASTLGRAATTTNTGTGLGAAVRRALIGAMSNPMPWAVLAGAAFSLAEVKLTGPAYTVISMLADAASPVALFTIGAVLWRAGQHAHTRTPMSRVLPVVGIKLLLHPLLVLLTALAARRMGAPLSMEVITVLVLNAALPSASNVSILAERYGADNGRIARIILLSTALAFVTFSVAAWMFGVGAAP